jgi:hypothetical protein
MQILFNSDHTQTKGWFALVRSQRWGRFAALATTGLICRGTPRCGFVVLKALKTQGGRAVPFSLTRLRPKLWPLLSGSHLFQATI